jgi:hypothetical protein
LGLGVDFFFGGKETGSDAFFGAMVCFGAGSATGLGSNLESGFGIGFGLGDGGKFFSVFFSVNRFFKNTSNRFNSVLFPGL